MPPTPDPRPVPSQAQLAKKRKALYERALQRVQPGGTYSTATVRRLQSMGYKGPLFTTSSVRDDAVAQNKKQRGY